MSSGFVTEAEIEEKRRLRQLEWDQVLHNYVSGGRAVRKPDEPEEAPPEPVDNRSLFDRLQEQKNKKQDEFEEAHKLKNLVKVLDDDEVHFLDQVDQVKVAEEKRRRLEEAQELNEFRSAVSQLREKEIDKAIHQEMGLTEKASKQKSPTDNTNVSIGLAKTSQSKLVASLVKRKFPSTSQEEEQVHEVKKTKVDDVTPKSSEEMKTVKTSPDVIPSVPYKGNLVCIGVLPGLDSYADDDEDDNDNDDDSDSDQCDDCESESHKHGDKRDLCGRRIEYENKEDCK